jgi:hypothetical protein
MGRVWFIIGDGGEGLVVFIVFRDCPILNALEGCVKDGLFASSEVLFDGGVLDIVHKRFL